MRFGSHGTGSGLALSVALFSLSFTSPVLAQEGGVTVGTESAATPASPSAPQEAEEPGFEEPQAEAAEPEAPASPEASSGTKPSPAAVDRDRVVGWVGVERLPGSAFPNEPVRGIKGGSLWMTFHGQQWPYMPAINGEAGLRLGFSGSVWADGSYARINSGLHPNKRHAKRLAMESRAVLRATPTYSTTNGWFVQGQAEIVALGDQITSGSFLGTTDDLYVRVGKWGLFDLTVGRFQGWEIANHYGMGLDLNTLEREGAALQEQAKPKPLYGLTYMWHRKDQRTGRYALHIYPLDILRF